MIQGGALKLRREEQAFPEWFHTTPNSPKAPAAAPPLNEGSFSRRPSSQGSEGVPLAFPALQEHSAASDPGSQSNLLSPLPFSLPPFLQSLLSAFARPMEQLEAEICLGMFRQQL